MTNEKIPIACNLDAFDPTQLERYKDLRKQLLATVAEIKQDADGYSFCWRHEASTLTQIAEWVSLERLCCPFLQFTIKVLPAGGSIWLKLGEGSEIKELLKHEFGRIESDANLIAPPEKKRP